MINTPIRTKRAANDKKTPIRKYIDGEDEEASDHGPEHDEPVLKKLRPRPLKCYKEFWKVGKPGYSAHIFSCPACNSYNYADTERFAVKNCRLYVTTSFCENCVDVNFKLTNINIQASTLNKKQYFQ